MARKTVYVLTEEDVRMLREMHRQWDAMPDSARKRPHVPPDTQPSTECYVALIPAGGISGMSISPVYTDLEFPQGNIPSFNTCDIYQLQPGDYGPQLIPTGFTRNVYNLSVNPISSGTWVHVTRDKYGTWWAQTARGNDPPVGDYTGTGTGTGSLEGGYSPCDPVTVTESEIWCVDNLGTTGTGPKQGDLQLFERTITLDILNGCLTKTTGAWRYVRTVGCCDPSCISDGNQTGTGTGTGQYLGPPVATSCCPGGMSQTLYLSLSAGNGTLTLTYNSALGYWTGSKALTCGQTLYVRFNDGDTCLIEFCCDDATYVPATCLAVLPATTCFDCGPPVVSTAAFEFAMSAFNGCSGGCNGVTITGELSS